MKTWVTNAAKSNCSKEIVLIGQFRTNEVNAVWFAIY